jgi:predicted PurR-regulated permease PerM
MGHTAASMSVPLWRRPRSQLFAITALVWAFVLAVLVAALPVLLPFILAALAAYVIDPLIGQVQRLRLGRRRAPRWVATLLVFAGLSLFVYLIGVSIVPQIYREAVRGLVQLRQFLSDATPQHIEDWAREIDAFLLRYGIPLDVSPEAGVPAEGRFSVDLAAGIAEALKDATAAMRERLGDVVALSRSVLAGTVETLVFFIVLFMLTAFISVDAPRIVRFFETLLPTPWRDDYRRLLHGIDTGLAGVVRGQLTIMLVNGLLTLVGLLVLRIPFAFALSALATILYVVPIFGTILSSVPIVLLALTGGGVSMGLLALGYILVIHALEAYVLNPKIMGDASKIHPVLIVLALVIGERSWGLVGALLAVPVASVFVAVFRFLHRKLGEVDDRTLAVSPATPDAADAAPFTKGSEP